MRRSNDLTLSPHVHIDREALAGGVFATAANLGMSVGPIAGSTNARPALAIEVPIQGVAFNASASLPPTLGLQLVDPVCQYGFTAVADRSCRVVAQSTELNASLIAERAEQVAGMIRAQLVMRQVLAALRIWGFTILERDTDSHTVMSQRARLPLALRPRPSARTTRADFVLNVDHAGTVSVRLNQLRFANRQTVTTMIHDVLTSVAPTVFHATLLKPAVAKTNAPRLARIDAA